MSDVVADCLFKSSEPDGYTADGIPIYLKVGRGSGKSTLQLEVYRRLVGIPDEEWEEIKADVERSLYGEKGDAYESEDSGCVSEQKTNG